MDVGLWLTQGDGWDYEGRMFLFVAMVNMGDNFGGGDAGVALRIL